MMSDLSKTAFEAETSPQAFRTPEKSIRFASVTSEIKQVVRQHLKTAGIGQARFASMLSIGAGTVNNLLRGRKPPLAAVWRLDEFFQRGGCWVQAFKRSKKPKCAVAALSFRQIRIYSLAEYANLTAENNSVATLPKRVGLQDAQPICAFNVAPSGGGL